MPVEAELFFTFRVPANFRFLDHCCSCGFWFAERAGRVVFVGSLCFEYPAAPWAFKLNFFALPYLFVWCKRDCFCV